MAVIKLNLTEDVLKLVSCIRFRELPHFEENDEREHVGYEIDMQSIYGGDFLLEDMSFILGLYDQHIVDTEEDADGPKFPKEVEEKMINLHLFILDNLDSIEEIVHQHVLKGGVTPGVYKCKDYQRIWERCNED